MRKSGRTKTATPDAVRLMGSDLLHQATDRSLYVSKAEDDESTGDSDSRNKSVSSDGYCAWCRRRIRTYCAICQESLCHPREGACWILFHSVDIMPDDSAARAAYTKANVLNGVVNHPIYDSWFCGIAEYQWDAEYPCLGFKPRTSSTTGKNTGTATQSPSATTQSPSAATQSPSAASGGSVSIIL